MTASRRRAEPDKLIVDYLEFAEQAGLAATTRYCRERSLARLAAALPVPLIEATPDMLRQWRAGLAKLSDQSVLNYVTDARQFYAWALAEGMIEVNPAARLPVPHQPRRYPRPISTPDLIGAILAAPDPIRIWLILAAYCGLRCKEIALLRRERVLDTQRQPCLLIARDATKGRHEHMVPLSPYALGELRRSGMPVSGWMFARADGKRGPNSPHTVSTRINRYLRELGIAATAHQLRHWFGSEAYAVGSDLLAVADMMGHLKLESTRGYALINQDRAARIVAAFPVPESPA